MTFLATNWWFFMIHFVIKSRYLLWTRDASDIVLSGHIADCVVFSVWCYFRYISPHTKTLFAVAGCMYGYCVCCCVYHIIPSLWKNVLQNDYCVNEELRWMHLNAAFVGKRWVHSRSFTMMRINTLCVKFHGFYFKE